MQRPVNAAGRHGWRRGMAKIDEATKRVVTFE